MKFPFYSANFRYHFIITQIEDLVYHNPNSSAFVDFYIIFKNKDKKEKLYISKKEYTELSELLNEIEL